MSIALMLIVSCGPAGQTNTDSRGAAAPDTLLSVTGASLPPSSGPALILSCSGPGRRGVTGYFSPTPAQLAEIESRLPAALAKQRSRGAGGPPPRHYYRQYVGIVRSGGQRAVVVNAFSREHLTMMNALVNRLPKQSENAADTVLWRHEAVSVCDGGREFWSVEFDLGSSSFRDFTMNEGA